MRALVYGEEGPGRDRKSKRVSFGSQNADKYTVQHKRGNKIVGATFHWSYLQASLEYVPRSSFIIQCA